MHKIFTALLFLCTTISFSQNVTLKGKVTYTDDTPLESATIYITAVKDSTVVDYTLSDKKGNWELKTRKYTQPVHLKVSFLGLADHKQQLESISEDRDFGAIKLLDKPTELDEVVVEGEIPPIRMKKDTLEFNASSFKVRPDANVETLLKQLPGIEIDSDGKITKDGKEVNQILVNGKSFFDKDGKIALQSLPADIINKVQVTDTKTKKEELSGQAASGNNATINLTIDKDKNKGYFGRITAGYGTDDRYEASGIINYFKDKRKISVLASSNNINSRGFSNNEIFDSMGGGRVRSTTTYSSGGYGINGIMFGSTEDGITRSNILGVNYSDEWFKNFDSSFNYFYTTADTDNISKTRNVTFLPSDDDPVDDAPEKSIISESNSRSNSEQYNHNFNSEFTFKVDSTSTLYFTPRFARGNSISRTSSNQVSRNQDNDLLNESEGSYINESDNSSFNGALNYNKIFNKRGRSMSISFDNTNTLGDGYNLNQSTTLLYEDTNNDGVDEVTSDIRNQKRLNRQVTDLYNGAIEFVEPVRDSLNVKVGVNYNANRSVEDREGYDFNEATGRYSDLNDLLTNYMSSDTKSVIPYAGISINKKSISFDITAGTQITNFNNFSSYLGENYRLNREFVLPSANANFRYSISSGMYIYSSYDYEVDFPRAEQVLPVADLSNQLYREIGNPDLEPNKQHSFYISMGKWGSGSGYSLYGGASIYDSQVVSSQTIEESGRRLTTYENVSGTYNGWFGINWNKTIKTEAGNRYRYSLGLRGSFGLEKGLINDGAYEAHSIRVTPRAGFTYEHGEILVISPTYNFSYNETNYTNFTRSFASNVVHRFNLETTSYWPKNVVWGNDFGYTYNSQISSGFRKDFYLWNTSIGYNFLQDKLMFKVKVYDVLNQNTGVSRYIGANTIYDSESLVLKRYVMFSLSYKLDKFGGDKDKRKPRGFQE